MKQGGETRSYVYLPKTLHGAPDFLQLNRDHDFSLSFPVCESCPPHKQLRLSAGEN